MKLSENVLSCELHTADGVDGWILRVRDGQRELDRSVPTISRAGVGTIEIDRDGVIWGSVIIAGREEEYLPGWDLGL